MTIVRIAHYSDTHGMIPEKVPSNVDLVVHSGDLPPNWSRGFKPLEETRQTYWLEQNRNKFAEWLDGKPCLMVMGNHCFVRTDVVLDLPNVFGLGEQVQEFCGLRFIGFPWVPALTGEWNLEVSERAMDQLFAPVAEQIAEGNVDVLVTHAPVYGRLDRNADGVHCGSKAVRGFFDQLKKWPKAHLFGHIHESKGLQKYYSRHSVMQASNAATGMNIVEIAL